MNKSYSKIRHIQESNQILEKRILSDKKDQGVKVLGESESGGMDKNSYETLSKEDAKQEGDKYTAWGRGMSPDQSMAQKQASFNARTKISKNAGQVAVSEVERKAFKENNTYIYFIKMST